MGLRLNCRIWDISFLSSLLLAAESLLSASSFLAVVGVACASKVTSPCAILSSHISVLVALALNNVLGNSKKQKVTTMAFLLIFDSRNNCFI